MNTTFSINKMLYNILLSEMKWNVKYYWHIIIICINIYNIVYTVSWKIRVEAWRNLVMVAISLGWGGMTINGFAQDQAVASGSSGGSGCITADPIKVE